MTFVTMALVLLIAGFYVGWNIGANDAANCIGTMVGARVLSFRKAALLMGLFVILGGVLQGHHVMKTVGKGIIVTSPDQYEDVHGTAAPDRLQNHFPEGRLPDVAILVALVSAGLFVTVATFTKVPVSTSQAIVGGVAGVGIGIVGLDADYFKISVLMKILACWVISPVLSMALAFVAYRALSKVASRMNPLIWSRSLSILVILAAAYVSACMVARPEDRLMTYDQEISALVPSLADLPQEYIWP